MADANVIATVVGVVATAFTGFLATRMLKRTDARAEAEAALIGLGPKIIDQQNVRIDQLSREVDAIWRRERECMKELDEAKVRIALLERKVP